MLNLYNYYDDPESLTLYTKLSPALGLYANPGAWNALSRTILEPLEHNIAKQSEYAYQYALDVLQGRFPEGEPAIMKDAYTALEYAKYIIGGRWIDAEPYIKKEPFYAVEYAIDVIQGRFEAAEPYIKKNEYAAYDYAKDILSNDPEWCKIPGHENGRWPEVESMIKLKGDIWGKYKQRFGIE